MISARILEQENPEFEASLAYVLTCLSGDVGATAKLTSCFRNPCGKAKQEEWADSSGSLCRDSSVDG